MSVLSGFLFNAAWLIVRMLKEEITSRSGW
jgi:hypothetical protein